MRVRPSVVGGHQAFRYAASPWHGRARYGYAQRGRERGSMAIEVIILVPILFSLVMLIVAGGRLVQRQGQVDAAARDAVRAASMERSFAAARTAASQTANVTLGGQPCQAADLSGSDFRAGGLVRVSLTCTVSYADLGLVGLPGQTTVTAVSTAPLDIFRRAE